MMRSIQASQVSVALLLASAVVAGGCGGDKMGRQAISGAIEFDGQPLESGSIQFSPHQHSGIASGGVIRDGTYEISRDKGLPPEKYLVRIFSPQDVTPDPNPAPEEVAVPGPTARRASGPRQPPPAQERIPSEYNVQSKQIIEVTSDGDNVFDFKIDG